MGVTQLMPRAPVVRPGWNVAAHTDAEVLHAAIYYEFKTHVESLLQRGPYLPGGSPVVFSVPDRPLSLDVKSCRRTLHVPGITHEEGMRSWV